MKLFPQKENTEVPKICELCGEHFNDDEFFQTKIPCGHFFFFVLCIECFNDQFSLSKIDNLTLLVHIY